MTWFCTNLEQYVPDDTSIVWEEMGLAHSEINAAETYVAEIDDPDGDFGRDADNPPRGVLVYDDSTTTTIAIWVYPDPVPRYDGIMMDEYECITQFNIDLSKGPAPHDL